MITIVITTKVTENQLCGIFTGQLPNEIGSHIHKFYKSNSIKEETVNLMYAMDNFSDVMLELMNVRIHENGTIRERRVYSHHYFSFLIKLYHEHKSSEIQIRYSDN